MRPQSAAQLRDLLGDCAVDRWTTTAAKAWWTEHATAVAARSEEGSSGTAKTIAVAAHRVKHDPAPIHDIPHPD